MADDEGARMIYFNCIYMFDPGHGSHNKQKCVVTEINFRVLGKLLTLYRPRIILS